MRRLFRRATLQDHAERGNAKRLLKAVAPRDSDFAESPDGLVDVEWRRRAEAARLLGALEGDEVTDALVARLQDFTPSVRLSALRSLASRSDIRDAEMVRAVLLWSEEDVRRAGEHVLVDRADADASAASRIVVAYVGEGSPPEQVLDDDWARLVFTAVDAAEQKVFMEHAVQRWLENPAERARARQVVSAEQTLGVDVLLGRLELDARRRNVAMLLGELRDSRATESLVSLLRGAQAQDREAAARALAQIQDPRAVPELLRVAADPVFAVRDAAQRALDALGTAGVVWSVAAAARGALDGAGLLATPEGPRRLLESSSSEPQAPSGSFAPGFNSTTTGDSGSA